MKVKIKVLKQPKMMNKLKQPQFVDISKLDIVDQNLHVCLFIQKIIAQNKNVLEKVAMQDM